MLCHFPSSLPFLSQEWNFSSVTQAGKDSSLQLYCDNLSSALQFDSLCLSALFSVMVSQAVWGRERMDIRLKVLYVINSVVCIQRSATFQTELVAERIAVIRNAASVNCVLSPWVWCPRIWDGPKNIKITNSYLFPQIWLLWPPIIKCPKWFTSPVKQIWLSKFYNT